MKNVWRMIVTLFLMLSFSATATAQGGPTPIGNIVHIGSITIQCVDPYGNQVQNYFDPNLNQAAMASVIYGGPAIIMNPQILHNYGVPFSVFAYAHECAHHYLGHVVNPSYAPNPQHELSADCYAAKSARDYGWLPKPYFWSAMQVLYGFQADPSHPPGPYRVQNAQQCYNTP